MTGSCIAVIDIGKTNAKLAVVDADTLTELAVVTRPNTVLQGPPWPHFDVDGHWTFLLDALSDFHRDFGISAISVTTHGACAALVGHDGQLAAPVLDYEHDGPDSLATEYDAVRPPFSETGSPRLSMGLNLGAQLFWQFQTNPGLLRQVRHVVTYPQYWGYRLTGVAATDVTSLGCHTDLWNPHAGQPSALNATLGIVEKLATVRRPGDVLGLVLPDVAKRTGLAADTPVYCGIHDSNASLLPHLMNREAPFSVVSSGTWVIAMAIGGLPVTPDPVCDTLINVNAYGDPVPSARFMGGREHDLLMNGAAVEADAADSAAVLDAGTMFLPPVVADTGPFQGGRSGWSGGEPEQGSGRRSAATGFYLALVTAHCLGLVGHRGPVLVEGPFARNRCYLEMLAAAAGSGVFPMTGATGTSQGAALLAAPGQRHQGALPPPVRGTEKHRAYAARWQQCVRDT
ncbi:FGGY-family carbohydrate kinase [Roseobacter sp. S98]|uniref:FGGY-family carbohydrate kinase n=1 Tax=Roseobacter algicola (ex Choi et al. 2025) (nom. illeg.) TaxID=3092138 RepID=UPI003F513DB9